MRPTRSPFVARSSRESSRGRPRPGSGSRRERRDGSGGRGRADDAEAPATEGAAPRPARHRVEGAELDRAPARRRRDLGVSGAEGGDPRARRIAERGRNLAEPPTVAERVLLELLAENAQERSELQHALAQRDATELVRHLPAARQAASRTRRVQRRSRTQEEHRTLVVVTQQVRHAPDHVAVFEAQVAVGLVGATDERHDLGLCPDPWTGGPQDSFAGASWVPLPLGRGTWPRFSATSGSRWIPPFRARRRGAAGRTGPTQAESP